MAFLLMNDRSCFLRQRTISGLESKTFDLFICYEFDGAQFSVRGLQFGYYTSFQFYCWTLIGLKAKEFVQRENFYYLVSYLRLLLLDLFRLAQIVQQMLERKKVRWKVVRFLRGLAKIIRLMSSVFIFQPQFQRIRSSQTMFFFLGVFFIYAFYLLEEGNLTRTLGICGRSSLLPERTAQQSYCFWRMVRWSLAILESLSSILLVICYMLTIKVDEPPCFIQQQSKDHKYTRHASRILCNG